MNFKLDENIGRRGVELLQSAGHDVVTVTTHDSRLTDLLSTQNSALSTEY